VDTKKGNVLSGAGYNKGCNWCDLPSYLPPYSTVFWHYKQWQAAGVLDRIMTALHPRVRQQVKKNQSGQGC
jgi:transposase